MVRPSGHAVIYTGKHLNLNRTCRLSSEVDAPCGGRPWSMRAAHDNSTERKTVRIDNSASRAQSLTPECSKSTDAVAISRGAQNSLRTEGGRRALKRARTSAIRQSHICDRGAQPGGGQKIGDKNRWWNAAVCRWFLALGVGTGTLPLLHGCDVRRPER